MSTPPNAWAVIGWQILTLLYLFGIFYAVELAKFYPEDKE